MDQVKCTKYNVKFFFVLFSELAELRKQIEEEIKASVSNYLQNLDLMTFPSSNLHRSLT